MECDFRKDFFDMSTVENVIKLVIQYKIRMRSWSSSPPSRLDTRLQSEKMHCDNIILSPGVFYG